MFKIHLKEDRSKGKADWQDPQNTFSHAGYFEHEKIDFHNLRAVNIDYIMPQSGFEMDPYSTLEIINIPLEGTLEHKDNLDNTSRVPYGDILRITTGKGIVHTIKNPQEVQNLHIMQIIINSLKPNEEPEYEQKKFDICAEGKLQLIASQDGSADSLKMRQDVEIYLANIKTGNSVEYKLDKNRKTWIQAALGSVEIKVDGKSKECNGKACILEAGDAMSASDETGTLKIEGTHKASTVLILSLR
ncbi:pirin-like protein [Candidatus Gastranaerophilus sp. (ex Termes propinquus)]|nr:pirin-like protein [Candidatus Gastranaerophilus sp. (ex Termes propinquus)]